jgi:hypothetical protein
MMVQIRPRVSLGLPSAMSSFLIFTNFTYEQVALSHGPQGSSLKWALGSLAYGWVGSLTWRCRR